ncbi:rubrerythrin [Candidatus Moduliflexus flocculans]|uniref:Rubrerythrin n=1 Tax=Candidatus Moduliflexus flocculans TaxID=1499966 RepID=A0A081BQ52_9BACT|nr:rubrerythrin [Candidatus Moduliflexus flocculans]
MRTFESLDEILDFAIAEEEAAAAFYRELAAKMERRSMREVFEGFAREEDGHKAKLLAVQHGATPFTVKQPVFDLKIADYVVDVDANPAVPDMDYQQALILAMKKEKGAFRLYTLLGEQAQEESFRTLFLGLAQEEAKHKLRFELEYDEQFLHEM